LAEVYSNLGNILQAQGKVDEAVACQERALALKPDLAEAHFNLGNILQDQDKLDEAAACYERAVAHKPGYAVAHHSLGRTLRHLGNVDQALVEYRRALAVQPDYAQARLSQALAQLLQGDFGAGWRNFESRWQSPDQVTPMRAYWQPLWSGEKLAAGRVLIWGEQGIGDEIMFAGLIPDAVRTGNRFSPVHFRAWTWSPGSIQCLIRNWRSPPTCPAPVCRACSGRTAPLLPPLHRPTWRPM
jgi:hypothetical protein